MENNAKQEVKIKVKLGKSEVNISFPIETTKSADRFEKIIDKSINAISDILDKFDFKEDKK
jgi:hypothetical protein